MSSTKNKSNIKYNDFTLKKKRFSIETPYSTFTSNKKAKI